MLGGKVCDAALLGEEVGDAALLGEEVGDAAMVSTFWDPGALLGEKREGGCCWEYDEGRLPRF
jgi:hypothetical protein